MECPVEQYMSVGHIAIPTLGQIKTITYLCIICSMFLFAYNLMRGWEKKGHHFTTLKLSGSLPSFCLFSTFFLVGIRSRGLIFQVLPVSGRLDS